MSSVHPQALTGWLPTFHGNLTIELSHSQMLSKQAVLCEEMRDRVRGKAGI
ncbi:hypothetical protein COLO4_21671 [Corchorus olitorius]|uniref:Uncharacterized protein n=1 Tax=Corchorus olitorius TaxID=93759 RepID=A0A1R3IS11_9ROSI|nr:hypothetical protein COLO4_21671 [Corchorus olitorius]